MTTWKLAVASALLLVPILPCSAAVSAKKVATGAYPELTVDRTGDAHLIYVRDGLLRYQRRDARTGAAAAALHGKADTLPGGEKVASAAHTAADAVGTAADYVRDTDVQSMLADVQRLVKNNPGPALLTAAALGFLIARTFSRE